MTAGPFLIWAKIAVLACIKNHLLGHGFHGLRIYPLNLSTSGTVEKTPSYGGSVPGQREAAGLGRLERKHLLCALKNHPAAWASPEAAQGLHWGLLRQLHVIQGSAHQGALTRLPPPGLSARGGRTGLGRSLTALWCVGGVRVQNGPGCRTG